MNHAAGQQGKKAVCLFSGGLDSMLAVCLMREQGIAVHGVVFESVLFGPAKAHESAAQLGLELHSEDFTETVLPLLRRPSHGFGAGLNPCIDCHIGMLRRAGQWMDRHGFDFIATGEVAGERPMSQGRRTLELVARESGYAPLVLRPLSARLLPETEPEKKGWVKRDMLLAVEGRSRKPQMKLARKFGLVNYPQPAGGCLLTDPGFSARLKDLLAHEGPDLKLIGLLRVGRHFRFEGIRLIVGRNRNENELILAAAGENNTIFTPEDVPGPVGLAVGEMTEAAERTAAAICARYSDFPDPAAARIAARKGPCARVIQTAAAAQEEIEQWRAGFSEKKLF